MTALPVPLLPRPAGDKDVFTAKLEGFFPLDIGDVRRRLALAKHLAPEGVASPLAQLHYLTWRLEDQTVPLGIEAANVLRLTVLLQYLGHLEPLVITLASTSDLGWLAPVLERSWESEAVKNIVVWKIRGLGSAWEGQAFAGSHRACPLFPGATFYPDRGITDEERKPRWQEVREALIAVRGPQSKTALLDRAGGVADPTLAAALARYLNGFISAAGRQQPGWVAAFKAWRDQLVGIAAGAQVPPDSQLSVSIRLSVTADVGFACYPGASVTEAWSCVQCRNAGESWTNTAGTQSVTAADTLVKCTKHALPLQRGPAPVGPRDYGAYASPDGLLYVWTEVLAQPPGCTRVVVAGDSGRDGSVTYWFNKQQIKIEGRLVSLDAVILPTVAWMARKPREAATPIDVPVSGAYGGLVVKCEVDGLNRRWMIKFHGLREVVPVDFRPDAEFWKKSAIVVWPPEECAGWTLDYVAASTGRAQAAGFRLIEETADGKFVRSAVCRTEAVYRTQQGVLRYVEVGRIVSGDEFESLGLLAVRRETVTPTATTRGRVVLDFGTSNSAVRWQVPGAVGTAYVLSGEDPARPAKFLSFDDVDFESLLSGVDVLAPWNRKENPARRFMPSLHATPVQKGSQPTIPPRGQGLDLLADPGAEPRILSGLKWRDWQAPGIEQRLYTIVELTILPAVWALRKGGCLSAELTATYPLAFDRDRKETYRKILTAVTHNLRPRTGLTTSAITLVSESAAGSSFMPKVGATHVVALDVGGGTTDLVVHVGAAGTDLLGKPEGAVLAADSLEYAGRDFLRAVVVSFGAAYIYKALPLIDSSLIPPDPAQFSSPNEVSEAYVASLEALIHRHRVDGLLRLMREPFREISAGELQLKYAEAMMRWEALLAGLMLYAHRMAEACVAEAPKGKDVSISFNLFGMGWELLRILAGDLGRPASFSLKPRFETMCANMSKTRSAVVVADVPALPLGQEPKTVVVDGAVKFSSGDDPSTAEGPGHALAANIRKTFVGMDLYAGAKVVVAASTRLEDASPRPTIVGDPGYARLIEDLFGSIPEFIQGTKGPLRSRVRAMLLDSAVYKRQSANVMKDLVDRGQDDFNRETWPPSQPHPQRNLLAGFLSAAWRSVWSGTSL